MSKRRSRNQQKHRVLEAPPCDILEKTREKKGFLAIFAILLLFGLYHSILYFGYQEVPNPDFAAFMSVGHDLWSFHIPQNYKRAPLFGLLIVPLGWICGGIHPDLTGGWLLNAMVHPFNLILLWLIAKQIVGKAGLWVALFAILNPQVMYLLSQPLAETLLLFFTLLSFYLMFRRSNWAYAAAALTTMVRYEGAALILAAFVMDMVYLEDRKKILKSLGYAFLASIPLMLWMLGMALHWDKQSGHYLQLLYFNKLKESPLVFNQLWSVTFSSFMVLPPGSPENLCAAVKWLCMGLAVLLPFVSIIESIIHRNWKIIALLIFFIPYMVIHLLYEFTVPRFYATVHWALLLLFWHGIQALWNFLTRHLKIPRPVIYTAQALLALILLMWFFAMVQYLPRLKPVSPKSYLVPYIAFMVIGVLGACGFYLYRYKGLSSRLLCGISVMLFITTNQFQLAPALSHGEYNLEFKQVALWYAENGKEGEGIVTNFSEVMMLFVPPEKRNQLMHSSWIKAENPIEFVRECRKRHIKYVAWDSRLGLRPNDYYYEQSGLKNIEMLRRPADIGPYRFIRKFQNPYSKYRYVHLFEIVDDG